MSFWQAGARALGLRPGQSFGLDDPRKPVEHTVIPTAMPRSQRLIYVIRSPQGHLKIGVSSDPSRQLAELQARSAARLSFAYIGSPTDDADAIERTALELLDLYSTSSDDQWFDVPIEVAIVAIAAAGTHLRQKIVEIPTDKVDYVQAEAARRQVATALPRASSVAW